MGGVTVTWVLLEYITECDSKNRNTLLTFVRWLWVWDSDPKLSSEYMCYRLAKSKFDLIYFTFILGISWKRQNTCDEEQDCVSRNGKTAHITGSGIKSQLFSLPVTVVKCWLHVVVLTDRTLDGWRSQLSCRPGCALQQVGLKLSTVAALQTFIFDSSPLLFFRHQGGSICQRSQKLYLHMWKQNTGSLCLWI